MRLFHRTLWIMAVVGLSACSQLPADLKAAFSDQSSHSDTREGGDKQPPAAKETAPAEQPNLSLKQIIRLIEAGEQKQAHAALKDLLAKDPENAPAHSLLQQLDADPVHMLGKPARTYTVKPGDTLGGLAERFLGDPFKFVILARYNQIARSKDLRAGQVLKLPADRAMKKTDTAAEPPQDIQAERPSDQPKNASDTEPLAPAVPDQTTQPVHAIPDGMSKPDAQAMRQVRKYHEQALVAYRRQDLDKAIALWNKALTIDPTYEPALGYRARALELKKRLNQLEKNTP